MVELGGQFVVTLAFDHRRVKYRADDRGVEFERRRPHLDADVLAELPFSKALQGTPTPVGAFLGRLADAPREAFDRFEVRRATPDDWVLETVRP